MNGLTERELDAHIAEFHGEPELSPLDVDLLVAAIGLVLLAFAIVGSMP